MVEIIVSHNLTDLDGLGAMVAASRFYRDAKIILPSRLHRLTKDFLVLYKDELDLYRAKDIDFNEVERVIIVDTHKRQMLGEINDYINWEKCEVIIYDHHPHEELEWVDFDMSEEVGSATSILVNKLAEERIELNPFEATVCALAIYADTGNLIYLNTTSKDAGALSLLLEAKANLKLINEFIKDPLTGQQQNLMEDLIKTREDLQIDGINVSIYSIKYDKYIVGINRVVEQLKRLYNLSSLFVLVEMEGKVQVTGRSSDEAVDIGKICTVLGGGGHAGAGAFGVKGKLSQVRENLMQEIKKRVRPLLSIKEIMSSPVRTVMPEDSIEEVEKVLEKYGHNAVVVYDGKIRGIFSRRDINKVRGHNLLHAPVKAYMSREVITVSADAQVQKAQRLMVKHSVGRLPVVNGEKLIGIVTRSDVLASYYGNETPFQHKNRYGSSLVEIKKEKININNKLNDFNSEYITILKKAGEIAEEYKLKVYLIGGLIRDLFLRRKNRDMDLVVEGNITEYIEKLADELGGKWSYNEQFRTGNIILQNAFNIDIAAARRERYFSSGELPEIEESSIVEDLFRRDYTVNVLALDLLPDNWGELWDFFQARNDIEKKRLKVLHRFSFLDDPTRIIRGVRLAYELDFSFEEETRTLIDEAVNMGDFSRLSPVRIIKELRLIFKKSVNEKLLKLIQEIPLFRLLNIKIEFKQKYFTEFKRLEALIEYLRKKNYNIEEWAVRMALFFDSIVPGRIEGWGIKGEYKEILTSFKRNQKVYEEIEKGVDPYKLVDDLKTLSLEELLVLIIKAKNINLEDKLKYYIELMEFDIDINGYDLIGLGLNPGPDIRKVLDDVYQARLKGKIKSRKEELKYARQIIAKIKEME